MAKEKKEKPPKKERPPKKEKAPKVKKEKDPNEETLLQKLMRQAKIKGAQQDESGEAAETAEEGQEKAGSGKRKLILLIAAAVLVLAAVAVVVIFVILPKLSGQDGETPPPPEESSPEPVLYDLPESYEVGEEIVKAVEPLLRDGVQAEKDVWVCYTYTGMSNAGAEAEAYVSKLKAEGFTVVDAEFVACDPPDYETAEGTVLLAKNIEIKPDSEDTDDKKGTDADAKNGTDADTKKGTDADAKKGTDADTKKGTDADTNKGTDADAKKGTDADAKKETDADTKKDADANKGTDADADKGTDADTGTDTDASASPAPAEEPEGMVLTVELTWAPGTLTVVCDQTEGKVTFPQRPQNNLTPGATMTMWEAENFLRELEPSVLGLEGESMEDYRIYAIDGAVLVNGQPCMRLNIYSREEGQSNEVAGIYLMSRDGQHLYLLDEEAKSVREVKLP